MPARTGLGLKPRASGLGADSTPGTDHTLRSLGTFSASPLTGDAELLVFRSLLGKVGHTVSENSDIAVSASLGAAGGDAAISLSYGAVTVGKHASMFLVIGDHRAGEA